MDGGNGADKLWYLPGQTGESGAPGTASTAEPLAWVMLDNGYRTSCGVLTDGRLVCWGYSVESSQRPTESFTQVSLSSRGGCGLDAFLPGRTFADLVDLNAQAVTWCQNVNAKFSRPLGASPDELWLLERDALVPLPDWIPEPVEIHPRRVDQEGYVNLHKNRYSVPEAAIGHMVEAHETFEHVRVFEGLRLLAEHDRKPDGANSRSTLKGHRGRSLRQAPPRSPAEIALRAASPPLAALCDLLHVERGGHAAHAIGRLHRMWLEYPTDALERAVLRALEFGLSNLERIERMTLQNVRGDFFRLPHPED
jgi:hypothetical protein